MRRALILIALVFGLCGLAVGFAVAYYRLPPYHRIHGLITGVSPPAPHTPPGHALWRDAYRQQAEGVRIVMLGDSITRLGNWPALLGRGDIANLGIPGDTSYGVLYRAGDANIPPDAVVFILIGVNDVTQSIPVADTLTNIERIVRALPGRRVYLQSTLFTERPAWNREIQMMVEGQRRLCARLGCTFVDLNGALAPEGALRARYSADGIHLNAAGYAEWAEIIRRHMPE